jgi:alkylmercury lyase
MLAVDNMWRAMALGSSRRASRKSTACAQVAVSFEKKTATVTYDNKKTRPTALTAATTNAGYPCLPLNKQDRSTKLGRKHDGMKTTTESLETNGAAVELRPGVRRPDWSVVTQPATREALSGRTAARSGLVEKWSTRLDDVEDLVWRRVLELFPVLGRPPRFEEVARAVEMRQERLAPVLRQLQQRDLLAFDEATGVILHAYPFTGSNTGHRVHLGERMLNALCAVDALGVGSMYGRDVSIESSCHLCGAEIRIATAQDGAALESVSPASAVVWYDADYSGSCAATSCCPSITFFCSDDHLQHWLSSRAAQRQGYRLSPDEALEMGRALFGPVLSTPRQ